jgi:hypothetical protein
VLDSISNRLLIVSTLATPTPPFGLSLSFDKLRMIGNTNEPNTKPRPFGLSPSFDKLRMIGNTNTSNTKPFPFGLSLSKPSL